MFDSRRKPRCKMKYITLTQCIRALGREENALSVTWDRVAFCTHSSPLSHTYANVPLLTQVAWKHTSPHRNTKNPVWLDYRHIHIHAHADIQATGGICVKLVFTEVSWGGLDTTHRPEWKNAHTAILLQTTCLHTNTHRPAWIPSVITLWLSAGFTRTSVWQFILALTHISRTGQSCKQGRRRGRVRS